MKIKFLFLFLLFTGISLAQKKKLDLETSVMQQRAMVQNRINGFAWIPFSNEYTYFEDRFSSLMKADVNGTPAIKWLSIQEVNEKLGISLKWFSGFQWISKNEFTLNDGNQYYLFNPNTKEGRKICSIQGEAANQTIANESQKVAFTVDNNLYYADKTTQIAITEFTDKNIVSGQSIARNEFGIAGGIFWSPNDQFIAFYQKDESEVADYPLLDITTTPGSLTNIKYPMTGQKSEKPKVGIYDLKSKKTVYISPRGAADNYLTNLAWTPDNKYVVIAEVNRGQNQMWLNVYDANTGNYIKTLFEEKSDKWIEPEHPAKFVYNNNEFLWISERDGFDNIYMYDFNGKLIKQLTKNKYVVKEILEVKNDEVYFTSTGENPTNTLLYKVNLKGKQSLVTKNAGTHEILFSTNGTYIFDQYSAHDVPSKTLVIDGQGNQVKEIAVGKSKLDEYEVGTATIGTLKAKDGQDLYYRLIKPSNFDPSKKYPVLVYVYGGPHAQMITNSYLDGANLWMYWMAEQGYLVYTLDNHGSGERGVAFESAIHRQLGKIEMEDQLIGVDFLKSLPYVDANRLAVHGWSYGGFMTTSLMLRQAGTFKVGVAGGPVTDWKYYETMYGERYMDMPEENKEGYAENALTNYTKNLKGDLLLIHGTIDDVVVMQHNYTLIKKFIEDGVQVDFFPYPMHKHNVYGKDRVHLMQKILDYVIEHNQ